MPKSRYDMIARIPTLVLLASLIAGCTAPGSPPATPGAVPARAHASRWIPAPGTTYQIQYDGNYTSSIAADVYDTDMFDTPVSFIQKLHGMGRHVVCYISVGTWENWRPDAKEFPKSVIGKPDGGWRGERWLDVAQASVLEPIMAARMQLCAKKGFDAVDPDNIDGYENSTGFKITRAEQITYDVWVAQEAHTLGLSVAEKNDNNQVTQLAPYFDYAVTEQCWTQGWCNQFAVYPQRGALVIDVEYGLSKSTFQNKVCAKTSSFNENAILKHLSLNAWIVTCP